MILQKILAVFKNYKQYEIDGKKKVSLDLILRDVNPESLLEERIEWIQTLIKWISDTDIFETEPEKIPNTKIKYFLMVLENNRELKLKVQDAICSTLQELSSIEFFCEVGLPSQNGLFSELFQTIMTRILPTKPIGYQTSELMIALFPNESDILWLKNLDEQVVAKIIDFFNAGNYTYPNLRSDIEESQIYLVSQIDALGLAPGIRKRIPHKKMRSLPFFYLTGKLNQYLKAKAQDPSSSETQVHLQEFLQLLEEVKEAIDEVYSHLNRFGVSTNIVYQLERMKLFLKRTYSLIAITQKDTLVEKKLNYFIAELIEQRHGHQHAMGILSNNASLLAQKIIENNSQTGEHYIAKDKYEYRTMVNKAMGGGVLTALTVFIKFALSSLGMNSFFFGFFSALNYAGSFLLIQFGGYTLATKQPAATASALAHKLEVNLTSENTKEGLEILTDEIVLLTRTQIAAVFGNLLAVIPTVLAFSGIYYLIYKKWILSEATAKYVLHSTDIFGPSIIYAVFTGFLLWFSSVFAGWAQNWYSFNQLNYLISHNKKFRFVLGKEGANKFAHILEHGVTGLAGNISLGFFLGLLPEFLHFLGIPLEVRHVTLSTGALAAAVPSLGYEILKSPEFIRAAIGILVIGAINLGVSFFLAFNVALKAKKISSHKKKLIYQSVFRRFVQRPFSFFTPKSSK